MGGSLRTFAAYRSTQPMQRTLIRTKDHSQDDPVADPHPASPGGTPMEKGLTVAP